MRRKGFTLIELLVVIAIIGLLVSILVPSINQAQKAAKRAACAVNLSGIGKAIAMYQAANKDRYPYISGEVDPRMTYRAPAAYDAAAVNEDGSGWIFALDGSKDEDLGTLNMVENLNLLIKKDFLNNWKNFRCPQNSSDIMNRADPTKEPMWGFVDSKDKVYADYAYHNGYRTTIDGTNKARLYSRTKGNLVIAGDQPGLDSSGAEVITDDFGENNNTGQGFNHADEGINLLRADGSVHWSETIFGGADKNNVYAYDVDKDDEVIAGMMDNKTARKSRIDTVLIRIMPAVSGTP